MLELKNKSVSRDGNILLKNITLSFQVGDHVALIGPNGSGKTTLLRTLLDQALHEQRTCFFVPQELPENLLLSVHDFVMLSRTRTLSPWHKPSCVDESHVQDALHDVDLLARASSHMNDLSSGQRRRAALAGAFASEADVLLLDEPTAQLDAYQTTLFDHLMEASPRTVISATHHLDETQRAWTHLIALQAGELVFNGSFHSYFARGSHD